MTHDVRHSELTSLVDPDAPVRQIGTGFIFTEGPLWHPTEHYLLFSDMPGDVRRRWDEAGGVREVMRPSNKCKRHDLRRGPEPRHLRARDVEPRAPVARRSPRGPRLALRGQGAQQPERRVRSLRRQHLLLRPVVRADAALRGGASARAWLAGGVPGVAGRCAPSRRRQAPVRPAERPLLLARREQALRERHHAGTYPCIRRCSRRLALARAALRAGDPVLARGGPPRRDEVRREGQHLGDRARRHPGLLAARRAARHRAHSGDGGQSALGRFGVAHAVRVRDDVGVRGGDEGRTARRAVHAPRGRRSPPRASRLADPGRLLRPTDRCLRPPSRPRLGAPGAFRSDHGREPVRRCDASQRLHSRSLAHRAHHPGHAERRHGRRRRLRRERLAAARARAERGGERPPSRRALPGARG